MKHYKTEWRFRLALQRAAREGRLVSWWANDHGFTLVLKSVRSPLPAM